MGTDALPLMIFMLYDKLDYETENCSHYVIVRRDALFMLQLSYAPLWETLAARDMKKIDLAAVISPASLKKLQNHEPVSLNVLMKIGEALDVPIEKIVEFRRI